MNFKLTASMMCADYGNLKKEVEDLEAGGIDSFHIDIMDGRFVPNFAMSLNDLRYIASAAKKPIDAARPKLQQGLLRECIRLAHEGDGAVPVLPIIPFRFIISAAVGWMRRTGQTGQIRGITIGKLWREWIEAQMPYSQFMEGRRL